MYMKVRALGIEKRDKRIIKTGATLYDNGAYDY